MELDVHSTADGVLVVHHDSVVRGTPIASLTRRELPDIRLPNGDALPTLQDALRELTGLEVWVELKTLPAERDTALLHLLDREDPALVGVHAFDHRIIARLGRQRPRLRRGILSTSYPVDPLGPMEQTGATALWQEWRLIDAELVGAVHRRGWDIIAWTVPDAEAERLAGIGVDALCGNYPDRLRVR